MKLLEFASLNYEIVEFKLKDYDETYKAKFTSLRVDARSVPVGLHKYDIRGTDDDGGGSPVSINKNVWANHYGTIICDEWFPGAITSDSVIEEERYELEIEEFNFTNEHYIPAPVVYGIAFVDYETLTIQQIFSNWEAVLEAYKPYCEREDMFDIPEDHGFRIEAFFLQTTGDHAALHKPAYINYIATPESGLQQVNDIFMPDSYLSKPAYEPMIMIYCNVFDNDNSDKMLSYSVEMLFSVNTKGLEDYGDANKMAEAIFADYLVRLKMHGIDFNELYRIDMISKLKALGFNEDNNDHICYCFKLGDLDASNN